MNIYNTKSRKECKQKLFHKNVRLNVILNVAKVGEAGFAVALLIHCVSTNYSFS